MLLQTKVAVIICASLMLVSGVAYTTIQPPARETEQTNPVVPQPHPTNPSGTNTSGLPPVTPPGSNSTDPTGPAANFTDPVSIQELVNASNLFALEMYLELANSKDNLFFSPYSIFTALGMTYEGARNRTADEIRSVFHFPADNQTRWSLFKALIEKLNANDSGCNLSSGNALWIQKDFDILNEYVNTVQTYYKAGAENVDYKSAAEAARLRINGWVENQTNGKIKDLIPQGVLTFNTVLVLTNAIYFKGDWLRAFNDSLTKEMDFHPDPATTVKAKLMSSNDDESKFNYTESDGVQVLKMPYSGEKLSMLVLLPRNGTVSSVENMLTPLKLNEWRGKLKEQRVDVYFPKFKLETKYFLKDNLSAMGMPAAFTSAADFSGIDGKRDLFISAVIHQAFVSVDEKGTEAAAATAVVFERNGIVEPPVPVFNANHPFIFLIQDDETGNILFMGKVVDPTG